MIISPPFLPPRDAGQSDAEWLTAAMRVPPSRLADTGAPEGSFPLGHNLAWHNGIHLQAPEANGHGLAVRAIADGQVVFASSPTPSNHNPDDPQNYNPFDRPGVKTPAWTDNGCVIVEHRSSIGAEGAEETELVFYSLYMHLGALGTITPHGETSTREIAAGDSVWRKDEIGTPGRIYGHAGQIHLEVGLDQANLRRLIGREPVWTEPAEAPAVLPVPTADGRTDSIFGCVYVFLPASTPTHDEAAPPRQHLRAHPGAGTTTLGTAVWVRMSYAAGGCTFETFDGRGGRIAALPVEGDAEYNLFAEATRRHASLPESERATSSPSGWYELLRLVRNIGWGTASADRDPLPTNAAHWRRIANGRGRAVWADLNASGSFKFSDADFPAVAGWNFVGDDTSPADQRCDSDQIKRLIRHPDAARLDRMQPEQLALRLGDTTVRARLGRTFCKFPSEWDKATISARYGFVKELRPFKDAPDAWPRLEAHLKAISFEGLPAGYLAASWHVDPRSFIGHMRTCGWLSLRELCQLLPRRHGSRTSVEEISWATAQQRFAPRHRFLNLTLRKYGAASINRQVHFLAQTFIETAMWSTVNELGRAHQQTRHGRTYWPAPKMEFYGPFFGRGIMQLTWAQNYDAYGRYRSFPPVAAGYHYADTRISNSSLHHFADPRDDRVERPWFPRYDPAHVAESPYNACDSGGFYWASKDTGHNRLDINRVSDQGVGVDAVGRVSVLVNGGGYGYAERQAYASFIERFRGDSPLRGGVSNLTVTHGTKRMDVHVDFTPQRP